MRTFTARDIEALAANFERLARGANIAAREIPRSAEYFDGKAEAYLVAAGLARTIAKQEGRI